MANCKWYGCSRHAEKNDYCILHQDYAEVPLEKKKKLPIAKESEKRKKQNKEYHTDTRKAYLKKHPFCQVCPPVLDFIKNGGKSRWTPTCGKIAEEVHHKGGREGDDLNDPENMLSSCNSKKFNNGHNWLNHHPKEAMKIGIIISRIKQTKRAILFKK